MSKRRSKPSNANPAGVGPAVPRRPSAQPRATAPGSYDRKLLLTCAGLFLLVFLVFLPAASNDFVNYDDQDYVTENPHVKAGLTAAGVAWAFTTGHASNWHPLTWISHMIDCQLYGLKPWGHHLTSVLFHAVNAMLLFVVLQRMTGAMWKSLLVALLFGLHPLRVESVAWVAERKDVLSTFFWMLTLWAYVLYAEKSKSRSSRSKVYYGLALFFFVCGLMSKPMLVTLPFVLLLLDWWPLGRISNGVKGETARMGCVSLKRAVVEKVPFFALAALSSFITMLVQRESMSEGLSLSIRLGNAVVSYCRYVGKMFWPENLVIIYPHPAGHWSTGVLLTCGLILIALSATAFALRKRYAWFAVGWCWFLGVLVPAIGIVQVGSQSMADRYTYVPAIGILILFVWGGQELLKRWSTMKALAAVLVAGGVLGCISLTERQISYWKDSYALFRHAVDSTTDNVAALINLGEAIARQGNSEAAMVEYREALKIRPHYAEAMNNLGVQLIKQKRLEEAIAMLQQALKVETNSSVIHNNLGQALSDAGSYDAAILMFREAVRLRPEYPKAQHNWGLALAGKRQVAEAIMHFEEAVRLDPYYFEAHNNLGIAYYAQGRLDDAIAQFQAALRINPDDAGVRQNIELMKEAKAAPAGKPPGGGNQPP